MLMGETAHLMPPDEVAAMDDEIPGWRAMEQPEFHAAVLAWTNKQLDFINSLKRQGE